MKKVILLIAFLIVSLFAEKILSIPEIEQRKDQWCWSGSSTAILTYYGEKVSQGQIAQYAYGDSSINQWNWLFGNSPVDYNGKTYYPKGINYIMTNWNTPNGGGSYPLTEAQYKSEIDAGHPFVIRYGWNSGGGHFVVGMGYLDNGNYQLMNPWFGTGYTVNTYNWIYTAQGGEGSWTHTLTTNRAVSATTYALTITGGTGSGTFESGKLVNIGATVPSGKSFVKWSGAGTAIADSLNASTTITMPAKNLAVTAVFQNIVVPTYALSITGGTGSGTFESGKSVNIGATVPSGKSFVKWSGAGTAIADSLNASTTITMPAKDLAVTAVFEQIIVIDTSNWSRNFVEFGSWSSENDAIGSVVTVDTTNQTNSEISATFAIVGDNESLGEAGYAWGKITGSISGIYDTADYIKLTYSSSDSIRVVLDNTVLGEQGVAFGYTLPKTTGMVTVLLSLNSFVQPDWTPDSLKTTLDKTAVESISFEPVTLNSTTQFSATMLAVNRFAESDIVITKKLFGTELPSAIVQGKSIHLTGMTGTTTVAIYSLSGRKLFENTIHLVSSGSTFAIPELADGVSIVRVTGETRSMTIKISQ